MDDRNLYVAGDIGGTNLNLAVAAERDGKTAIAFRARYDTQAESGISGPLTRLLSEAEASGVRGTVRAACLAGAGVASDGAIAMSNVPWAIRADEVRSVLGVPALFVNDFFALLNGVAARFRDDPVSFRSFTPALRAPSLSDGTRFAAIGPGTGLGMGFAVAGDPPVMYPSEGGNARFPVWDEESFAFMGWMETRLGRAVCAEDWVSGIGIGLSYEYEALRAGRADDESDPILSAEPGDRAAAVAGAAGTDAVCDRVMRRFSDAYASCAADAALTFLPGILFLAGGITAKNADLIAGDGRFARRFRSHGKKECADALSSTPLYAVLDYGIGLYGALELAARQAQAQRGQSAASVASASLH